MKLEINGEVKAVPVCATVRELLESLGIKPDGVAVEVNRRIVKRQDWSQAAVKEFDLIEIVRFVGGG
jgi:thiamine biosynthesis protein ThiS